VNPSKKFTSLVILTILAAVNCFADGVKEEYKTDPASGVKYLFFRHDKKGVKPAMGDVAFIRLVYKRADDSLLFDSRSGGRNDSTSMLPLTLKSSFRGSLEQGIAMMSVGDSASFLVSADSIYMKVFKLKELPHFIKNGSDLKFYIKLVRFETQSQLKDEQYALIEKRRTDMQKMHATESDSIKKYLTDKKINVKPIMIDSLYILQRSGAKGKSISEGDSVELKYTGMLLNGTIFDQSDKGDGGKGTIKLLYRHNAQLIKGWLEVLETMHEGEKVQFLLPSSLAYGSYGAGKNIKPYTPLLFEIEVLKVISPFDK
jgi:FKBP-type peptidyl-prolyl cis-trans isomerase